jgi:hypothetical protein
LYHEEQDVISFEDFMALFGARLRELIEQTALPVRRIALLARLPHQTLHNWLNGAQPRWHARLEEEINRLAEALGLEDPARIELLGLAGLSPIRPAEPPRPEVSMNPESNPPRGWIARGKSPTSYEMGSECCAGESKPAAFLKSRPTVIGFGTLMQEFSADAYRNQRIRFSAEVRSQGIVGWAGLWMRVDDQKDDSPSFDNMQNRPIVGTTGWTRYDVVLDVPDDSIRVALGILLEGTGQVWMREIRFEVVTPDVPCTDVTGSVLPDAPQNLELAP